MLNGDSTLQTYGAADTSKLNSHAIPVRAPIVPAQHIFYLNNVPWLRSRPCMDKRILRLAYLSAGTASNILGGVTARCTEIRRRVT